MHSRWRRGSGVAGWGEKVRKHPVGCGQVTPLLSLPPFGSLGTPAHMHTGAGSVSHPPGLSFELHGQPCGFRLLEPPGRLALGCGAVISEPGSSALIAGGCTGGQCAALRNDPAAHSGCSQLIAWGPSIPCSGQDSFPGPSCPSQSGIQNSLWSSDVALYRGDLRGLGH